MEYRAHERLKMIRESLGYTRGEFTDEFGFESSRIGNIEKGRTMINVEDLEMISRQLSEVICFLVYGGNIWIDDLEISQSSKSKLLLSIYQAGRLANEEYLNSKFKYRHGNQES